MPLICRALRRARRVPKRARRVPTAERERRARNAEKVAKLGAAGVGIVRRAATDLEDAGDARGDARDEGEQDEDRWVEVEEIEIVYELPRMVPPEKVLFFFSIEDLGRG